jgi:hypothetical protein
MRVRGAIQSRAAGRELHVAVKCSEWANDNQKGNPSASLYLIKAG